MPEKPPLEMPQEECLEQDGVLRTVTTTNRSIRKKGNVQLILFLTPPPGILLLSEQ